MRVPIFSGKGIFFGRSLGKISRENQEKGFFFFFFFVIANGNQYPRWEGGGYIHGYLFPEIGGSGDGE